MFRLALCVDPNIPETSGIVQKALRSMKPEFAKNDRDRSKRAARAARLSRELLSGSEIPWDSVYPSLGERWGRSPNQGIGIQVPAISLRRLTEKIVKGIYFLDRKVFIEPPYEICFYALTDEGAGPIKALIETHGREYAREPGIVVRLVIPEDEPMCSLVEISVWGQFKMYASVEPNPNPSLVETANP